MTGSHHHLRPVSPFSSSPPTSEGSYTADGPYGALPVLLRVATLTPRREPPSIEVPEQEPPESIETQTEPEVTPEFTGQPEEVEPTSDPLVFSEVPDESWEVPRGESSQRRRRWQIPWQPVTAAAFILLAAWLVRPMWLDPEQQPLIPAGADRAPNGADRAPKVAESQAAPSAATSRLAAADASNTETRLSPARSATAFPSQGPSQPAAWTTWPEVAEPLPQLTDRTPRSAPPDTGLSPDSQSGSSTGPVPGAYPQTQPETSHYEYPPGQFEALQSFLDTP